MVKEITCECGFNYRGEEDDLVTAVQEHARTVHNMQVSREQVLAQATPISA
jgi:predicted small metal-binding protein